MGRTKADEKATNRFQMIAPLLNETLFTTGLSTPHITAITEVISV